MPFGTMIDLDLWTRHRYIYIWTDSGYPIPIYNFPLFINEPKFYRELQILKYEFSFAVWLCVTVGPTEGEDRCYPNVRKYK